MPICLICEILRKVIFYLNLFYLVLVMKLDDIKLSVSNSVIAELKHAFYNSAAVLDYDTIVSTLDSLFNEVFEKESATFSE